MHVWSVFFHQIGNPWGLTLLLIAVQTWLYVGMFIIAHDTMHSSLARTPAANRWAGRIIMFVYAGFDFDTMQRAHMAHHKHPGTEHDPDFNAADPHRFWPWYFKFFTTYFGLRQVAILAGFSAIYLLLGAPYVNLVMMWAVPAVLSSVQLFTFGTYLTHKHGTAFADHHNARTNSFPRWLSLLTCLHFGYHHEHHLYPQEPWWRLPARRFPS